MEKKRKRLEDILRRKEVRQLLQTLRVLCGSMRFRILMTLKYLGQGGLTVTELALILNVSLSRISHQLKILKDYNLIVSKKIGGELRYSLADHRAEKYLTGIGI